MLDALERLPDDPILGLAAACRADPNPQKVDLTLGIYMDDEGVCPVFDAVRRAQAMLIILKHFSVTIPITHLHCLH